MPTPMTVKVVAERGTGRLLGAQIVGGDGAAKRIDTCAAAITAGFTVAAGASTSTWRTRRRSPACGTRSPWPLGRR